eukprot:CAMPEP_0168520122 /NCGR_PEP_ID=MMETSP0405-20121227/7758_1 /TAXON_ID=498012 /ORGANISM="Trichosphaerium sp, Strain Am-I-7 wt" /LENGTH=291 /DNA_ID=CAMNT_0008540861 /DNA_START=74 /DNA_END=946 /DNA_ORIENTATION=-
MAGALPEMIVLKLISINIIAVELVAGPPSTASPDQPQEPFMKEISKQALLLTFETAAAIIRATHQLWSSSSSETPLYLPSTTVFLDWFRAHPALMQAPPSEDLMRASWEFRAHPALMQAPPSEDLMRASWDSLRNGVKDLLNVSTKSNLSTSEQPLLNVKRTIPLVEEVELHGFDSLSSAFKFIDYHLEPIDDHSTESAQARIDKLLASVYFQPSVDVRNDVYSRYFSLTSQGASKYLHFNEAQKSYHVSSPTRVVSPVRSPRAAAEGPVASLEPSSATNDMEADEVILFR